MLSSVVAGALRAAMKERLVVNHARAAYRAEQVAYRRELAETLCPCNNTDTQCEQCRTTVQP